jgi:hypothetical protein
MPRHHLSASWLVPFTLVIVLAAGCGKKEPTSTVTGKVTLNGQPVAGTVAFVGPDNKQVTAPINPDGTYTVASPPTGQVRILVKSLPGAIPGAKPIISADMARTMPVSTTAPATGQSPPARYAWPNNGLTFNVTGGKQSHDITLVP